VKAECQACGKLAELSLAPDGDAVRATCALCGKSFRVGDPPAAGATAVEPPAAAPSPPLVCPKCGQGQPPAEACRRCGLVFARWKGQDSWAPAPEQAAAVADVMRLWADVEARWSDAAAHEAFLTACSRASLYAFAAARYRGAQATRGAAAEPAARDALARVAKMAEAALLMSSDRRRGGSDRPPYRRVVVLLTALMFLVLVALAWLVFFHKPPPATSPDNTALPPPLPPVKAPPSPR
jgi:hypothetical protein